MYFETLEQWLAWQTALHPRKIELGLTRVDMVARRLNLLPLPFPVISVAGTNGKGSSVVLLDSILSAAGYQIGRFTSPHLLRYNERISIAGIEATDTELCQAFHHIETVRRTVSLTFFEWSTLAALLIFKQYQVDLAVLEVGLGGRLDAVNIVEPNVALVTSIDIDHTDWLGDDRESIGFEKAGIFRSHYPAVCSDLNPPQSLIQHAQQLETPLYCLGHDFTYHKSSFKQWSWQSQAILRQINHLPLPYLNGDFQLQNAAGVLMVLTLLSQAFSISETAIRQGLVKVNLPGRFQVFTGRITRVLDVTHNPSSAQVLAYSLSQQVCHGETHAIVGLLKDKNIEAILNIMQHVITHWHIADLNTERSASTQVIKQHLMRIGVHSIHTYTSITKAYQYLLTHVPDDDRIIAFGSFYTVAEALQVETTEIKNGQLG